MMIDFQSLFRQITFGDEVFTVINNSMKKKSFKKAIIFCNNPNMSPSLSPSLSNYNFYIIRQLSWVFRYFISMLCVDFISSALNFQFKKK